MRGLADQPNCYLVAGGWAYRFSISDRTIAGQTLTVPLSFVERAGLDGPGVRRLEDIKGRFVEVVRKQRWAGVAELGRVCRSEGAQPMDAGFLVLTPQGFRFELRRWRERPQQDPLARLLWHCGLSPDRAADRQSAWRELGIALGGMPLDADQVVERLAARSQEDMIPLVREALRPRVLRDTWPAGWSLCAAPAHGYSDRFAVTNWEGDVRVAVGVTDGFERLSKGTHLTDGGIKWTDTEPGSLTDLPADSEWSKWMIAEHHSRRSALGGMSWWLALSEGGGWLSDSGAIRSSLRGALASVPAIASVDSLCLRAVMPYPKTGIAWTDLIRSGVEDGLVRLEADRIGFKGTYEDGSERRASTLPDLVAGIRGSERDSSRGSRLSIGIDLPAFLQVDGIAVHSGVGPCRVEAHEEKTVEAISRRYAVLRHLFNDIVVWVPLDSADTRVRPLVSASEIDHLESILLERPEKLNRKVVRDIGDRGVDWSSPTLMAERLRDLVGAFRDGSLTGHSKAPLRDAFQAESEEWSAALGMTKERMSSYLAELLELPSSVTQVSRLSEGQSYVGDRAPDDMAQDAEQPEVHIVPYVAWEVSAVGKISSLAITQLQIVMDSIITVEGPVTADRIYRVITTAAGVDRITRRLRKTLNRALFGLHGVVIAEFTTPTTPWNQRVVRQQDSSPIAVREIGPREFYEIPMDELATVLGLAGDCTFEKRCRSTLEHYGVKRLTEKAKSYLWAAETAVQTGWQPPGCIS